MKIFSVILVFIFVFVGCGMAQQKSGSSVKRLDVRDKGLKKILETISVEKTTANLADNRVYVMKVNKLKKFNEFRFTILTEDVFEWYLSDKKDTIVGFFEYKQRPVLVFGEMLNKFFIDSKDRKSFDFLNVIYKAPDKKPGLNVIEEPPSSFEPIIWIYHEKNNKIKFFENGRVSLLQ